MKVDSFPDLIILGLFTSRHPKDENKGTLVTIKVTYLGPIMRKNLAIFYHKHLKGYLST